MSIKAKNIKKSLLRPARKLGVVVVEGGKADQAITRGSELAAGAINEGKKQVRQAKATAESALEELRASIHAATAPRPRKK